jgi:2-polyprenyl-3-methyl-5-hydroxy-6-metoxy-1,4-benzoquinol methylase
VTLTDASACPACGGTGRLTRLIVHEGADPYRLRRCGSCHTQYLRPGVAHPQWADESRYWEHKEFKIDMYAAAAVRDDYDDRYRSVLRRLRAEVGGIRTVLDVGCGVGNFLSLAGREGLVAVGVDVDPRPVEAARRAGLSACTPADLDDHVADGSVDAVTMWDVIEHVIDPGDLLRNTVRKLRPGGVLIIETPDASFPLRSVARLLDFTSGGRIGLARRLYYWEHKTYFSESGLRRLLASQGCETRFVDRMTSPRAKMAHLFSRGTADGGMGPRLLERAWPWLESTTRHLGLGNKLLAVASR